MIERTVRDDPTLAHDDGASAGFFHLREVVGRQQNRAIFADFFDVAQHLRIFELTRLLQPNDAALRSPGHRPGHVQRGGRRGSARDDEGVGQRDPLLELHDLVLDPPGEVSCHHHEVLLQLVVLGGVGRQLGADGEQLALDPQDDGVAAAILDQRPRGTQRRDRFVDRAVSLGPRISL